MLLASAFRTLLPDLNIDVCPSFTRLLPDLSTFTTLYPLLPMDNPKIVEGKLVTMLPESPFIQNSSLFYKSLI